MKEKVLKNTTGVITISPSIFSSISKIATSEKWRNKKEISSQFPEFPSWVSERPFLSWDFYPDPEKFESVFISNF
jgi:hypothetical protein